MDSDLQHFLQRKLAFSEGKGPNKVMDLSEAIRRFVAPGMTVHAGASLAFPTAAYYEIVRQFWGKTPGFTLVGAGGGATTMAIFVHGKLCTKIISSFNGDAYPFPSPNPIMVRAFRKQQVVFEDWTMLTLNLRLLAGAMGVPFLPTKSIQGSTMEDENQQAFRQIRDPFDQGQSVGLVKALNPDISLAHGWAADVEGNTILAVPHGGNAYGALAARRGAIVTVEKIVDEDFIRRHSYLVKIPGYVVKAVCPSPFGAHPGGHHALGLPDFEGYGEDQEFILEARQASRDPERFQDWIDKWILGCEDHGAYLSLLGHRRIWYLKGRIQSDSWTSELSDLALQLSSPEDATPAERMILGASQRIKEIIKEKDYQLMLCGVGASNLAAWLAYYDLRHEGRPVEIMAEIGFFGYSPRPSDPFIFNLRNLPTCRMTADIFTIMGILLSGSQTSSLGVLGAGQVDRFGNTNSTKIPEAGGYLVGSGGANDVASGAKEVVVTLEQTPNRFLDRVPYVTSPGARVTTVVSQLGIFEKRMGEEELILTGYFPSVNTATRDKAVAEVKSQCGWDLKVHPQVRAVPLPSSEGLRFLRCFDPRRLYLGGSKGR